MNWDWSGSLAEGSLTLASIVRSTRSGVNFHFGSGGTDDEGIDTRSAAGSLATDWSKRREHKQRVVHGGCTDHCDRIAR